MSTTTAALPKLEPIHEQIVCPWTAAHPRHDHQLIFPLDPTDREDGRLWLIWSEYYANRPSAMQRDRYDKAGGFKDEAPCRLSGKLSRDRGRTWSETFTVQDNHWRNVKHPNLLRLEGGGLLLTFTAWEHGGEQRNLYARRSDDNGETWGPMTQIGEPGWYCTNHDRILRLSDGRVVLPAHGGPGLTMTGGKADQPQLHSFMFLSDDDGRTWRMSPDQMTAPGRGAHEPSVVELADGTLMVVLRTTQRCPYRAFSENGGEHWSEPEPMDLPAPDAEPLLKRMPGSEDLLLVWNRVASDRNWPRTPLASAISRDRGDTWSTSTCSTTAPRATPPIPRSPSSATRPC